MCLVLQGWPTTDQTGLYVATELKWVLTFNFARRQSAKTSLNTVVMVETTFICNMSYTWIH